MNIEIIFNDDDKEVILKLNDFSHIDFRDVKFIFNKIKDQIKNTIIMLIKNSYYMKSSTIKKVHIEKPKDIRDITDKSFINQNSKISTRIECPKCNVYIDFIKSCCSKSSGYLGKLVCPQCKSTRYVDKDIYEKIKFKLNV